MKIERFFLFHSARMFSIYHFICNTSRFSKYCMGKLTEVSMIYYE